MEITPQNRFIKVGDVNTHYWDEGQGSCPFVLVHGINASVSFWQNNIVEFAKDHRVIALDLIGFGDTDKPKVNYNVEMLADFLKDFLDKLNITKCILVGHSLGGGVSLEFATSNPDYIKQLVLVSSAGFSYKLPLSLRIGSLPVIGKILIYMSSKLIASAIRSYVYNKESITDAFINNNYRIIKLPGTLRVLANLLRHNMNIFGVRKRIMESMVARLSVLKMPILIIWGKQDKLLPVEGAYRALDLLPQAELKLFDQCGHVPQIEYADEFNKYVCKHVESINLANKQT